jgi:hypothetical protein
MTDLFVPIEVQALDLIYIAVGNISLLDYGLEDEIAFFKRPLGASDPNLSIGMWLESWEPQDDPSIGMLEPDLCRYTYGVMTLAKVDNREDGLRISAILTKKVRLALARDKEFRVQLEQLQESEDGFPPFERFMRSKFERQRYQDEIIPGGGFLFMSVSVFSVDTETVS